MAEAKKAEKATVDPEQTAWEPVKIKLFKDNDKYKDDVFVAVNGRTFLIKRGEEVEVPRCVKEVLDYQASVDAQAGQG